MSKKITETAEDTYQANWNDIKRSQDGFSVSNERKKNNHKKVVQEQQEKTTRHVKPRI